MLFGYFLDIGVATPISKKYPNNKDRIDKTALLKYIKDNGYIFPSLFDETGKTYAEYEIEEYPSSFIIDRNGHLKAYIKGAISKEELKQTQLDILKYIDRICKENDIQYFVVRMLIFFNCSNEFIVFRTVHRNINIIIPGNKSFMANSS